MVDTRDPDDRAFVAEPKAAPSTEIQASGSLNPFTIANTYAVSASLSTAINYQVGQALWLRSFSIAPLSSTISVAFFFRYGNWTIGGNPPVVNSTLTLAGVAYSKNFKDGTGRYPQLNSGDVIQLILIASGSGYVSVDIDAEFAVLF
jgi:hypothetical protein